ncbi:unnamed protein product [Caenorhabditis brenneri]
MKFMRNVSVYLEQLEPLRQHCRGWLWWSLQTCSKSMTSGKGLGADGENEELALTLQQTKIQYAGCVNMKAKID